jgi:hypothetical protein
VTPRSKIAKFGFCYQIKQEEWLPQEISGGFFLVFIHVFSFASRHFLNFYNEHGLLAKEF